MSSSNQDPNGPSRLRSWFYWAKKFEGEGKSIDAFDASSWASANPVCKICSGFRRGKTEDGEELFCLCSMYDWARNQQNSILKIESPWTPRKLSELKALDRNGGHELATLRTSLVEWMKNPTKEDVRPWKYIYGVPGCGKSHILMAVKRHFGPLALYLSMENFISGYKASWKSERGMTTEQYVREIISAPILLLDDIGLTYDSGNGFAITMVLEIVNTRLLLGAKKYPVLVTSNIPIQSFLTQEQTTPAARLGSRMADKSYSEVHHLAQTDYRINQQ